MSGSNKRELRPGLLKASALLLVIILITLAAAKIGGGGGSGGGGGGGGARGGVEDGVLGVVLGGAEGRAKGATERAPMGFISSLPIYWGADGFSALGTGNVRVEMGGEVGGEIGDEMGGDLGGDESAAPHWARRHLEQRYRLEPISSLSGDDAGAVSKDLQQVEQLIIAQPNPMSPADMVALDHWLRGGGRLLMITDPHLTEEFAWGIGDPRHPNINANPQALLHRWGLRLSRVEPGRGLGAGPGQKQGVSRGESARGAAGVSRQFLADHPGQFSLVGEVDRGEEGGKLSSVSSKPCSLMGGGLLARCNIGKGQVLLLADAALLARDGPAGLRGNALDHLLRRAFDAR